MCTIAANASTKGEGSAFARSKFQWQFCSLLVLDEAPTLPKDAGPILTHEDAESLADQIALTDVQQLHSGAIDFENRRVRFGNERRLRHFIEQFPVLSLLIAQLCLQLFDPSALVDEPFPRDSKFFERGAQFRERAGQQWPFVAVG